MERTGKALKEAFIQKEQSAVEIVESALAQSIKWNEKTNAYLQIFESHAINKARELDKKRQDKKPLGLLAGIPIAVKDNIQMHGQKLTCGSKFLKDYISPYSASVIKFLESEDAIIIGKTNLDEFAMGSSNEYSAFGNVRNPLDLTRTPGGSSGGSAAAVASGCVPLSLGSDTGGSIRQPAAFTGTIGFKPTYGRVSRYGLVAFGSSLDQIGPFARSVEDIALIMEAIGRHCENDATSLELERENYLEHLELSIRNKKVGVPFTLLEDVSADTAKMMEEAMATYRSLGCEVVDVDLSYLKYSVPIYYIIATAEASTNLARFDGVQYTSRAEDAAVLREVYDRSRSFYFGEEVKKRILLGTFVLSAGYQDAYYKKAQKVRRLIVDQYKQAFSRCDVLVMPTTTAPAFELGSVQDPLIMYQQDIFTIGANLAGLPALSMPAGKSIERLPLGVQIVAPQTEDGRAMRFAHHFLNETRYHETFRPDGKRS